MRLLPSTVRGGSSAMVASQAAAPSLSALAAAVLADPAVTSPWPPPHDASVATHTALNNHRRGVMTIRMSRSQATKLAMAHPVTAVAGSNAARGKTGARRTVRGMEARAHPLSMESVASRLAGHTAQVADDCDRSPAPK